MSQEFSRRYDCSITSISNIHRQFNKVYYHIPFCRAIDCLLWNTDGYFIQKKVITISFRGISTKDKTDIVDDSEINGRRVWIYFNVNENYFTMSNTEIDFRAAIGPNSRGKNKINDVLGNTHFIGFQYSMFIILYILHFRHTIL